MNVKKKRKNISKQSIFSFAVKSFFIIFIISIFVWHFLDSNLEWIQVITIIINTLALYLALFIAKKQMYLENMRAEYGFLLKDLSERLAEINNFDLICTSIDKNKDNLNFGSSSMLKLFELTEKFQASLRSAGLLYVSEYSTDDKKEFYRYYKEYLEFCYDTANKLIFTQLFDNNDSTKLVRSFITVYFSKNIKTKIQSIDIAANKIINNKEKDLNEYNIL